MTQIKLFTETTYEKSAGGGMTIDELNKIVNDFLAENNGKITIKDIKYSVQSPNPHQILNLNVKDWTVMIIYETL